MKKIAFFLLMVCSIILIESCSSRVLPAGSTPEPSANGQNQTSSPDIEITHSTLPANSNKPSLPTGTPYISSTPVSPSAPSVKPTPSVNEPMISEVNIPSSVNANISNGGIAAVYGDWIYFGYYTGREADRDLYKMKTDGTGLQCISEDNPSYINVSDEYIFYCNNSHKCYLYRMKIDGSDKMALNNESSSYIILQDEWIYYVNDYDHHIYKIKVDGTEKSRLNDDRTSCINIEGNLICYIAEFFNNDTNLWEQELYSIKTDGTEKNKLNIKTRFFVVDDGYIYFKNNSDQSKLYKAKKDGSQLTKLTDNPVGSINIYGDWLYYSIIFDYNKRIKDFGDLYKIRKDGTEETSLKGTKIKICHNGMSIVGNWIIYTNSYDSTIASDIQRIFNIISDQEYKILTPLPDDYFKIHPNEKQRIYPIK